MPKKYQLSMKQKKLLMYKSEKTSRKAGGLSKFINGLCGFALSITIIAAVLFMVALILWPVLYFMLIILTLGLILFANFPDIITPVLSFMIPAMIVLLSICAALFIIRFIIEWLEVLAQSRSLKKNPEENVHHIAVARVVKKTKLINFLVFTGTILSVFLVVIVINASINASDNKDVIGAGQKVLAAICLIIVIGFPTAVKIYARKQFKAIDGDIAAIIAERKAKRGPDPWADKSSPNETKSSPWQN